MFYTIYKDIIYKKVIGIVYQCTQCGKIISETISDDNGGICDDCWSDTDGNGHVDAGLGDYDLSQY